MPPAKKRVRNFFGGIYREFKTRDAYPLLFIIFPIIFLIITDPASFTLVWFVGQQVGRAGMAFILFLVAWDFHDSRNRFEATRDKRRYLIIGLILFALLIYYYFRIFNGFFVRPPINPVNNTPMDTDFTTYMRVYVTSQLGVSQSAPLSFLLAMDYLTYAAYCILATAVLYSASSILLMATPVIYTIGSAILDMMDAFFPEDSLAFLQIWVYLIWNVVVFILGVTGFQTNTNSEPLKGVIKPPSLWLRGNRLTLYGLKGTMPLVIYWPSSGVVSMLVYSLVILVLMVKLDASKTRKIVYAVIGAAGTYFVNVIRITLIVLYITYISLDFEAFHASIGEVLFIAWIFIYLILVIHFENTSAKKQLPTRAAKQSKARTGTRSHVFRRKTTLEKNQ